MLKRVVITNYLGESMEYKIDGVQANNPSGLIITSIDGLGPVKANINMTELTTTDGQSYNSARLEGRNIVIRALFTHASSIEEARLLSYKFFPIKKKLKFRIETDNRIGETEGYVESNEPDIFSEQSGCQISVLCESSFFSGGTVGFQFSEVRPLFKFPFENPSLDEKLIKMSNVEGMNVREVQYDGDYETGIEMTMTATDEVYNPVIYKDGDSKHTSIITNKMKYAVPNTETGTIKYAKASYTWDANHSYEFFTELPFEFIGDVSIVYKDELYIIGRWLGERIIGKVYKWDPYTYSWTEICELPYYLAYNSSSYATEPLDAIVHKNYIYVFQRNELGRYARWNGISWEDMGTALSGIPIELNGTMCLIGAQMRDGSTTKSTVVIYDDENDQFGNLLYLPYRFHNGSIVIYNDTIHLIGSDISGQTKKHYKLNGTIQANSWSSVSTLPYDFSNGTAEVLNGEIHIFGKDVNNTTHSADEKKHYKWNGSSWTSVDTMPYNFGNGSSAVFDNKIYLFGTKDTSDNTCPAPPNNTHLIKDDQLVFTTIQGKKSLKLIRNYVEYNVLNALDKDPNWFVLTHGSNEFIYTAGVGKENLKFTLKATKLYEGV